MALGEHAVAVLGEVCIERRQSASTPPSAVEALRSNDRLCFGEADVTAKLAAACARFVSTKVGTATAVLSAGFTMDAGEVAVVAEVCARLTGAGALTGRFIAGDIYRVHAFLGLRAGVASIGGMTRLFLSCPCCARLN